jgi:hypothetical protein
MPILFPSGSITLSQICDEYGVSRNMNSLRQNNISIYDSAGNKTTIPSSGPISLNQFRGKYSKSYTGSISGSVSFSATDYNVGIAVDRVDCTVSYSGTYTIGGQSVIELGIIFNVATSVGFDNKGGVSASYRNGIFSVNGRTCSVGANTLLFTNTQSLTISAQANVYSNNSYGANNTGNLTDNYNASGTLGTGALLIKQ